MVEVGGTGVRVSPVQGVQQYTQQYVLSGGTSFSGYQQVGGAGCGRSWVWEELGVGGAGCGCSLSSMWVWSVGGAGCVWVWSETI